jgi:hypothetical protein
MAWVDTISWVAVFRSTLNQWLQPKLVGHQRSASLPFGFTRGKGGIHHSWSPALAGG